LLRRRLRDAVEARDQNRLDLAEVFSLLDEHAYWRDWGYPDFQSCIKQDRISRRTAQELINVHRTYVEACPTMLTNWR
jgi:hypothetical protein